MITEWQYKNFIFQFEQTGKYRGLRMGQAFINEFSSKDSDPMLFYATDIDHIKGMILHRYVKKED